MPNLVGNITVLKTTIAHVKMGKFLSKSIFPMAVDSMGGNTNLRAQSSGAHEIYKVSVQYLNFNFDHFHFIDGVF